MHNNKRHIINKCGSSPQAEIEKPRRGQSLQSCKPTDPELGVFGEAAQPVELSTVRDVSQVRVVMATQL